MWMEGEDDDQEGDQNHDPRGDIDSPTPTAAETEEKEHPSQPDPVSLTPER